MSCSWFQKLAYHYIDWKKQNLDQSIRNSNLIIPPIHFSTGIKLTKVTSYHQKKAQSRTHPNLAHLYEKKPSPKHRATRKHRNSRGHSADSTILMLKGGKGGGNVSFCFSSENKKSITLSWAKSKKLSVMMKN